MPVRTKVPTYAPPCGPCAVCGAQARLLCSGCRVVYYCGQAHQKQHRPQHHRWCGFLELRSDARLGRHVVAAKDVPQGAVLMRELPLVLLPWASRPAPPGQDGKHRSALPCVRCSRFLQDGDWKPCLACGCAICNTADSACRASTVHRDECDALRRAGSKLVPESVDDHDNLTALATLRICLAAKHRPELLELLCETPPLPTLPESHSEEEGRIMKLLREADKEGLKCQRHTISLLRKAKITSRVSEEELFRARVLLRQNANGDGKGRKVIYRGVAMLEHSCVPNVAMFPADDSEDGSLGLSCLLVVAARDIKKGEHVATSYETDLTLEPTSVRRERLTGFFCRCDLCEDPTERGLHRGSWYCLHCLKDGKRIMVTNMVSCGGCGQKTIGQTALAKQQAEFDLLKLLLALNVSTVEMWEKFVREQLWPAGPLHPTHHLVLKAKWNMVNVIRRQYGNLPTTPNVQELATLGRWEQVCRDLLQVLGVVQPGLYGFNRDILTMLFSLLMRRVKCLLARGHPEPENVEPVLSDMENLLTKLKTISDYNFIPSCASTYNHLKGKFDNLANLRFLYGQ